VNADIDHRGVELMEADGSKDIGQTYESLTPGSGTEKWKSARLLVLRQFSSSL